MASQYLRILPITGLTASQKQANADIIDVGAYTTLEFQARVLKAGGAGNVFVEHAAVNEPDAFTALSGATWSLSATSNTLVSVTHFLRYLRWVTDSGVAGSPIALIDLIAKE